MTAPPVASRNRGAVLVHVAILMFVLLAVSALAIDLGVMWLARSQAQNAADAGALAGAVSLAFESVDNTPTGPAAIQAAATANENRVFGEVAGVTPSPPDVTFPTCPDGTDTCIRVNVYRNQDRGNALPVFFARLFGVNEQGVQAMAIAQAGFGSSSSCMKPWAIPDRWIENLAPGEDPTLPTYDGGPISGGIDIYDGNEFLPDGKTLNLNYTGYKGPAWREMPGGSDEGKLVRLKEGKPQDAPVPGWFQPIDEPPARPGGNVYRDDIATCNVTTYESGDPLTVEPGNMIGPTKQGVEALIASDSGTIWHSTPTAQNPDFGYYDCQPSMGPCTGARVGAIAIYDPGIYLRSGRKDIVTKYLLGFYVVGMDGNDVIGRFVGRLATSSGAGPKTSWLRIIRLVR